MPRRRRLVSTIGESSTYGALGTPRSVRRRGRGSAAAPGRARRPAVGVGDRLDDPDLLRPAAVQRRRRRGQRALADGAVEVGVVVDADDLALVARATAPRPCWPGSRRRCSARRRARCRRAGAAWARPSRSARPGHRSASANSRPDAVDEDPTMSASSPARVGHAKCSSGCASTCTGQSSGVDARWLSRGRRRRRSAGRGTAGSADPLDRVELALEPVGVLLLVAHHLLEHRGGAVVAEVVALLGARR